MKNFKNCILLFVFSYSDCVKNKDRLSKLYKKYFKKIIFYSDHPNDENFNDINYIDINKGANVHKIFSHFYKNYENEIANIDGLFYTMDDNIINLNILNLYDSKKIIYNYTINKPMENIDLKWEHWNQEHGIKAINEFENSNDFKYYMEKKYSCCFSDYLYLPQKYLTNKLFTLFEIFSKHNIFLEISIPTIINHIENNKNNYNNFNSLILWNDDRNKLLNLKYVKKSFNIDFNLFVHPIKFNTNPKAFDWLENIFNKKKCTIITTINKPTETVRAHINNNKYDVIIVGDKKTPDDYKNEDCIYLDCEAQDKLFPKLSSLIPYNHYGRKNLGYIFAIRRKYKVIYETDDDNIPYTDFDSVLYSNKNLNIIEEKNSEWINIFKHFTNNGWIWPRGYPLSLVKKCKNPNFNFSKDNYKVAIINGLVENDPDVDALYRLLSNSDIKWETNKKIVISNKNICVFNTQNTFWIDKKMFVGMLLPCSVTFRYCDILKGIIANILLKNTNKNMMYTSPNVKQLRNEHNLINDFQSEYSMYIANEKILTYIDENIISDLKFIYLIQAKGKLPSDYEYFKNNKKYILLSYKENTADTDIFFPNSTWTTGRNKLYEYVSTLNEKYDYYVFLDEDITFDKPNNNFDTFEDYLKKYKPYIGNPYLIDYPKYSSPLNNNEKVSNTVWFDGICNAYSRKIIKNIFPLESKYDNTSWWYSQYILIKKLEKLKLNPTVFLDLKIKNKTHSEYPKEYFTNKNILNEIDTSLKNIIPLKINNKNIRNYAKKPSARGLLKNIYKNLYNNKIITELDLKICEEWLKYF